MSIRKVEKVSGIGSTRCSTGKPKDGRSFRDELKKAAKEPKCDKTDFSTSLGKVRSTGDNER